MRQRDYLFAGDAISDVKRQIADGIIDAHNIMTGVVSDRLESYLGTSEDPIGVIRVWKCGMVGLAQIIEEISPSSAWQRARLNELTRDTRKIIRWKASALGINPESQNIDIAVSGMRLFHDGEKWLLAIPDRAPEPMAAPAGFEPDDLILLDPKTGDAKIYGDAGSLLILPFETDRFTVHACARTWAREVAVARVEWLYSKFNAQKVANITPIWTGHPPSALLIGDVRKVRWPTGAIIEAGEGVDARKLQYAIYDQSRTSRVHQPQNIGRNAA